MLYAAMAGGRGPFVLEGFLLIGSDQLCELDNLQIACQGLKIPLE